MLSPTTKGLFHQTISESGTALSSWAFMPNPRQIAVELATYLKCPTAAEESGKISPKEILNCLKEFPADELNKAPFQFREAHLKDMIILMYLAPTAEPKDHVSDLTPFQTESPISILTRKDSNLPEIPWIVGWTEDEMACTAGQILEDPEKLERFNENFEKIAAQLVGYEKIVQDEELEKVSGKFRKFYFGDQEISVENRVKLRNMFSDDITVNGYKSALETASRGEIYQVYLYEYAYKGPINFMAMFLNVKGEEATLVGHADDLVHQFPWEIMIPGMDKVIRPETPDEEFSKNLVRLWASFAIYGVPKHSWGNNADKIWEPISRKELNGESPLTLFRIDGNPSVVEVGKNLKDRFEFWDSIWNEHFTPAIRKNLKSSGKQYDKNEL